MQTTLEKRFTVVTTIQSPTACMVRLADYLRTANSSLLIIGDTKGPFSYELAGAELITLSQQMELPFELVTPLQTVHYTRKNLGYLLAIQRGATSLYETDDDNAPIPGWQWRGSTVSARRVVGTGWINAYKLFSDRPIWPRGLPLTYVNVNSQTPELAESATFEAPIQQGLANGSPDVDAIWRLVFDETITFSNRESVVLGEGQWCPFNSQTTWWAPVAFPLLYLPSYCTFRMTDIWRSFVAQRCLWALGLGIVFHSAEVAQDRNAHNLIHDFDLEVPGYLKNEKIAQLLEAVTLDSGRDAVSANLLKCYEALVAGGIFPESELNLVKAWIADLSAIHAAR